MTQEPSIVQRLMSVILDRRRQLPEHSYTTRLFQGGVDKIAGKLREETDEVIAAAREVDEAGRQHLIREAADVVYHLLVLLGHRETHWSEVEAELTRRFGLSGLDEKAARRATQPCDASRPAPAPKPP